MSLGHENLIEFLLKNGANISAEDKDRYTPLHFAVEKGKLFLKIEFVVNKSKNDSFQYQLFLCHLSHLFYANKI